MLFVSTPSFYQMLAGCVLKPHPQSSRSFSLETQRGDRAADYPVKRERMPGPFRRHSRSPNVLVTSPPNPTPHNPEASWVPLTPCEQAADFQKFGGIGEKQHLNIWKALLSFLPGTETLAPNDGRKPACVSSTLCVCFTKTHLMTLFCEHLGYGEL